MDEIIIVLACVLSFAVQLILCFKVKNIWLRLIPTFLTFAVTAVFFISLFSNEGLEVIGYLLLAIFSSFAFLACALAWAIWGIVKLCSLKKKNKKL